MNKLKIQQSSKIAGRPDLDKSYEARQASIDTPKRLGFVERFLTLWIFMTMATGLPWVTTSQLHTVANSFPGRNHLHSHSHRPHFDDVSAAGQGAL